MCVNSLSGFVLGPPSSSSEVEKLRDWQWLHDETGRRSRAGGVGLRMGTINRGKALGPKTLEGYALKGEKEKRERVRERRERECGYVGLSPAFGCASSPLPPAPLTSHLVLHPSHSPTIPSPHTQPNPNSVPWCWNLHFPKLHSSLTSSLLRLLHHLWW